MTEFEKVVKDTTALLDENRQEWEQRYGEYIVAMSKHRKTATECFKKFTSVPIFAYYLSTTELKGNATVFTFSMRFLGQEVAKIKVGDKVSISTVGNEEGNKKYFDCTIMLPKDTRLESPEAEDFCTFFAKSDRLKGKSPEHTLESALISEFSKISSADKALISIQPVKVTADLRYAMPTPISASSGTPIFPRDKNGNYTKGGGIDILARFRRGNQTNLTVIELKDEYKSTEPPEIAMKQAIAYGTFLYKLLRSDQGNGRMWYNFLMKEEEKGPDKNLPEKLTINVVVAMPHRDSDDDKSFAKKVIELEKGDKLVLHYMYLHLDPNSFEIKEIDTSLNQNNVQK